MFSFRMTPLDTLKLDKDINKESQPTVRYRGGSSNQSHRIDWSCVCSYVMLFGYSIGVQQICTVLMIGKLLQY